MCSSGLVFLRQNFCLFRSGSFAFFTAYNVLEVMQEISPQDLFRILPFATNQLIQRLKFTFQFRKGFLGGKIIHGRQQSVLLPKPVQTGIVEGFLFCKPCKALRQILCLARFFQIAAVSFGEQCIRLLPQLRNLRTSLFYQTAALIGALRHFLGMFLSLLVKTRLII